MTPDRTADRPTRIGIVGPRETAGSGGQPTTVPPLEELVAAVRELGGDPVSGPIDRVLEAAPSALVAVGEAALCELVRADPGVPTLPIAAGARPVPVDRAVAALESVLAGEGDRRHDRSLSVDGEGRALLDVTLVADEPARITGFAVRSRDEPVARFRADGVVVATPAGSRGYANAAGGPLLSPAIDGVAVVPIGPFAVRADRWVLPADGLELSIVREETLVSLALDGEPAATVAPGSTVEIRPGEPVATLVVPESAGPFGPIDR